MGAILLGASGVTLVMVLKHFVRPVGDLVLITPLIALLWAVILTWRHDSLLRATACGLALAALYTMLDTTGGLSFSQFLKMSVASPVHAARSVSIALDPSVNGYKITDSTAPVLGGQGCGAIDHDIECEDTGISVIVIDLGDGNDTWLGGDIKITPAVEGGAYADGAGYPGDAAGREAQAPHWPAADSWSQPGYQAAFTGSADRGPAYRGAPGGTVDGYANGWNGWDLELNSSGFYRPSTSQPVSKIDPAIEPALRATFQGLLRRFVSRAWIDGRIADRS